MIKTPAKTLDAPDAQHVGAVLIFSFLAFFSVTFLMTLMSIGMEDNHYLLSWYDIGFHLLCLAVTVPLMREYLSFSWFTVMIQKESMITWVAVGVGVLLGYSALTQAVCLMVESEWVPWALDGSLPVLTNTLFLTNAYQITANPLFGTVMAAVVAPFTTCCIFYATAFAKGYNVRPWLGYVLVAAITLFPSLATGLTGWWALETQVLMYAVELPVHLICCWLYQKMDTIWAPILTQAVTNLAACIFILAYFGIR